jgi:predicted acylesterase/phospholipase RssA
MDRTVISMRAPAYDIFLLVRGGRFSRHLMQRCYWRGPWGVPRLNATSRTLDIATGATTGSRSKMMKRVAVSLPLITVVVALTPCGCAHLTRQEAVPPRLTQRALTPEASDDRYWPDLDQSRAVKIVLRATERERDSLIAAGESPDHLPPENYLAISSGGDDGAFAAGLLVGWSARGDRPVFNVVTGISAGALVAPFAFLGSRYDEVLRTVASRIDSRDIFHSRSLLAAFTSDGLADDRPLAAMIEKYVTADVLREVARAYATGRLLFIGTTNLDARQPVVWDMGAIAARGDAAALDLFRKVVLASASIPGVFPPVMIDVEVDGKRYQEMHVDGAVTKQVFLFCSSFAKELTGPTVGSGQERHLYVIRNGRIDAQWGSTQRRTTAVAHRALDALVDREAVNDIYQLQFRAQEDGSDLNIAYIDSGFTYPHTQLFAGDYMRHLFQYSYQLGANGYPWRKSLPDAEWPGARKAPRRELLSSDPLFSVAAVIR